jgi:hypothetical protein
MPSIPGYVYATRDRDLFVNLFIGGAGKFDLGGETIAIRQDTGYPWEGAVRITLEPARDSRFAVNVRIPGWALNRPVPADLYRYAGAPPGEVVLRVNGEPAPLTLEKGYVRLERSWRRGDRIDLELPMPVRRAVSHPAVKANEGRVALERGPVVYCVEGIDNGHAVEQIAVGAKDDLRAVHRPDLLGGVTVVEGPGYTAIPYYAWSNRGESPMAVWLPAR